MSIPPTNRARLGVVILSYQGAQLTLDCLESLQRDGYGDRLDIVVDNGSSDDVLGQVADGFPAACRIGLQRNKGFSAGNNVGIAQALRSGCDYVVLLNNDTVVAPGALAALVAAAVERPGIGAVSPLLLFADEPDRIWFAGANFDPCSGYPGRMHGYRRRMSEFALRQGPIGRFTGAAVLVPASVVRSVGMLDEDLFFLLEDVEWSLRIRAAGHPIHFEPGARIFHRVASTQGGEHSLASYYYGLRNQIAISGTWCPAGRMATARRAVMATAIQLARGRRATRPMAAARAALEGLVDAHRGRLGPWRRVQHKT